MSHSQRALTTGDLAALARLSAASHESIELYIAIDRLVQNVIGHRLLTMMRVHEAASEVERIYSSNPTAYPVGGSKQKAGTAWSRAVLDRGEVFIARNADEVREAFADPALIFSLGIGAILSIP